MSIFEFFMVGREPKVESCYFGVDLEYDESTSRWGWWEPGRPHSIVGTPAVAHPDGWYKITRPNDGPDVWFKRWGAWVWPYAPAVRGMTDDEAIEWADRFWRAELDSGGG